MKYLSYAIPLVLVLMATQSWAFNPRQIDDESYQCSLCHAGCVKTTNSREMPVQIGNLVHPIGLNYAEYVSFGGYVQEPMVYMPEGKLACTTCHTNQADPLKSGHAELVVELGQLCIQCHDK